MNPSNASLIVQLISLGVSQAPALITAIGALRKEYPALTAEQIGQICQAVAVDVETTTRATDAKLDAVNTAP